MRKTECGAGQFRKHFGGTDCALLRGEGRVKSAKGAARTARSERNFAPHSVLRVFLRSYQIRVNPEEALNSDSV